MFTYAVSGCELIGASDLGLASIGPSACTLIFWLEIGRILFFWAMFRTYYAFSEGLLRFPWPKFATDFSGEETLVTRMDIARPLCSDLNLIFANSSLVAKV